MLHELRVENLLLIERAELRPAAGLNVLTGETGAGKTVLAHALDLLLGGRARPGIVRPGAQEAYVEGAFELSASLREELGERLPADVEEIVLSRRVGRDGHTRAYLNGRAANVSDLREVGGRLLAFYGQHEHRKLTIATAQLEILDGLCGADQARRLRACAEAYAESRRLGEEVAALGELARARERELDLVEHELGEIDGAALREGEHEELLRARERLRNLDALASAAGAGAEALAPESSASPGAAQLLSEAALRLDSLDGLDPRLDELAERMRGAAIEAQDLAAELRAYGETLQGGEPVTGLVPAAGAAGSGGAAGTEATEERLATIERLMRKHGGSLAAVFEHAARSRARRDELSGADAALRRAETDLGEAGRRLEERVVALRSAREAAIPALERAVGGQLESLGMTGASFEVELTARDAGPAGGDAVEFMLAPNPGVPAAPIREIASGGELSRVMLALITASRGGGELRDRSPSGGEGAAMAPVAGATLVFDEVDAGIGGHTARAVGARLRALGEERQVLCITHLPQIASLGVRHFAIVKDTSLQTTTASVLQLREPEVVAELVRMLGADAGDETARRHARDLRRAA
jgi:DNA repair protein RecN (Recombination protein N)